MKTKCVTNRHGYEYDLKVGKEYEILNIQSGIFAGDHYITVNLGENKKATALRYRFDMSKEDAEKYIKNKD